MLLFCFSRLGKRGDENSAARVTLLEAEKCSKQALPERAVLASGVFIGKTIFKLNNRCVTSGSINSRLLCAYVLLNVARNLIRNFCVQSFQELKISV